MRDELLVQLIGDKMFLVESESGGTPHQVDLMAGLYEDELGEIKSNGRCSCTFFETNCWPSLRRTGKHLPYRREDGKVIKAVTTCKHIQACWNYLKEDQIMPLWAQQKMKEEPDTQILIPFKD